MSALTVASLLALLLAGPRVVVAASFTLGQEERSDAVRVGVRSVTSESFDAEWRVAAFKNERLKDDEPEKLLRSQQDRLVIWAQLRGPREDFARFYAPRILLDDRAIEPAFVQNERTALRTDGGGYLARCVYRFPTKDMTEKARLLLVIRDADGRDVSRFTIDLASMR